MEIAVLLTILFTIVAGFSFAKASGIKGKGAVAATFLAGVMLAGTAFGVAAEDLTVQGGGGLADIASNFVQ